MAKHEKTIGRCIYCGATQYDPNQPKRPLADEHIIPFSLEGEIILREASCFSCEREISKYEQGSIKKNFDQIRIAMGFRTNNPRSRATTLPATLFFENGKSKIVDIPVDEYPLSVTFMIFQYPEILGYKWEGGNRTLTINWIDGHDGKEEKLRKIREKHGAIGIEIENHNVHHDFKKHLAKMAHGMMFYFLDIDEFDPILDNLILNKDDSVRDLYVGCIDRNPPNVDSKHHTALLHPFGIPQADGSVKWFIGIVICLFQKIGGPQYFVAAGLATDKFRHPANQKAGLVRLDEKTPGIVPLA